MRLQLPTATFERLASLEQRISDHESRCEERLAEIRTSTTHTLSAIEGLKGRFWMIAISLLAWAMAQVWAGNQARLSHLEAAKHSANEATASYCGSPRLEASSST